MSLTESGNIYLIGMPGSGKSTLGKQLAKITGKKFVDLDSVIEDAEKADIPSIFTAKGEDYFRLAEHRCLKNLSGEQNLVVATGGGAACFHNNMELMNSSGSTVYLNVPAPSLFLRLKAQQNKGIKRPLIDHKSDEEIMEAITLMLEKRTPFYALARHTCTGHNISAAEIHKKIMTI